MTEKAYKAMSVAGVINIVVGVLSIVVGVTSGVVLLISAARLFKTKKGLTF